MKLGQVVAVALRFLAPLGAAFALGAEGARALQTGTVRTEAKLSGEARRLGTFDRFARGVASLGDLDGDGVADLAVGARDEDGQYENDGAVWIQFLAADGTVKAEQRIGAGTGGFGGLLWDDYRFGASVASLGDLDGDGVTDLAVGALPVGLGAVWILFLNSDGTVKDEQLIDGSDFTPVGSFGASLARLGDLDGDGITELAVGAPEAGLTDPYAGAVWILFLDTDGSVKSSLEIGASTGGFGGAIDPFDWFGYSLAALDDLNGDGVTDLAVGAPADDQGGTNQGAVWILFLDTGGSVLSEQRIAEGVGGFTGILGNDFFGVSVASLGDCDDDGTQDLAVGAEFDDDGGTDKGAVWILHLAANGTVASHHKLSATAGGMAGVLELADGLGISLAMLDLDGSGFPELVVGLKGTIREYGGAWVLFLAADFTVASEQKIADPVQRFGIAAADLGDLDGDGHPELAVGALGTDGTVDAGMVRILSVDADGSVLAWSEIGNAAGGFAAALDSLDQFGSALTAVGDLDGDGITELAVGAVGDDDGGTDAGAVWILFLDADGVVQHEQKISATAGAFQGILAAGDAFGSSLAGFGDLDGDGNPDLAVGAKGDDTGGSGQGAVWILFLDVDGTAISERKISETTGGFVGVLDASDAFGASLATLGDLDGSGSPELAVGAPFDDDGGLNLGALWILSLAADGTVLSDHKISATTGGFGGVLASTPLFGSSLARMGDLNRDGVTELAAGASFDDDGDNNQGAAWILFLDSDGTVRNERKISALTGGFVGPLEAGDRFGSSVTSLADLDGDGLRELVVGAPDANLGRDLDDGAVWILFLNGATGPRARRNH